MEQIIFGSNEYRIFYDIHNKGILYYLFLL